MHVATTTAQLAAAILGATGSTAITFGAIGEHVAVTVIGFMLLILGGIAWVHDQVARLPDRISSREQAAYNLGALVGDRSRQNVATIPQPRRPTTPVDH